MTAFETASTNVVSGATSLMMDMMRARPARTSVSLIPKWPKVKFPQGALPLHTGTQTLLENIEVPRGKKVLCETGQAECGGGRAQV